MTKLNRIGGLHHYAYRCRNAETRSFYEDLLGLPLAHVIQADEVPSTGASEPYVHLFFEFGDGSYIAFFDLERRDGLHSRPGNTVLGEPFRHAGGHGCRSRDLERTAEGCGSRGCRRYRP